MKRILSIYILLCFFITSIIGPCPVEAKETFLLPEPGQMVALSQAYSPAVLKGIKLDPKNPFRFHFFVDRGDFVGAINNSLYLKNESAKLIKYFLASLTIPEKDLWVNLSPYEKDHIVPKEFGQTEMGRDLLAQDYLLKQITASIIYPESKLGHEFWNKVYDQAQAKYGTTNIPINTFNKVWIVPDKAVVYENNGTAFVLENHLKVMLEQDYLSMKKHVVVGAIINRPINKEQLITTPTEINRFGSQIIRELVIPALTKEVNEGKNFSQLRQVFYSLILATWYKKKIKDSILNKVYSNRSKIGGVNVSAEDKDRIYQEYLKAFKKGVFNYIKDEPDPTGNQSVPRKYFSGGVMAQYRINVNLAMVGPQQVTKRDFAQLGKLIDVGGDFAMNTDDPAKLMEHWHWDDPRYAKYVQTAMYFARQYMIVDDGEFMASTKISGDGRWVGLRQMDRNPNNMSVRNLQTGECLDDLIGANLNDVYFSPDGTWLFAYRNPYKVTAQNFMVNLKTRKIVSLKMGGIYQQFKLALKEPWVDHVIFSSDSRWMAVRYSGGLLAIFDLQNLEKPAILRKTVQHMGFLPGDTKMWVKTERGGSTGISGKWIPTKHGMQVLDLTTGENIVDVKDRPNYLSEHVSPDGSKLLIEEFVEFNHQSLVYDFNRPRVDGMAVPVRQGRFDARFLTNNRMLITKKDKVEVHEFDDLGDAPTVPVPLIDLAGTWERKYLFTKDHSKILDANSGEEIINLREIIGSDPVGVQLSPDGRWVVATAKTEEQFLVNVQTKQVVRRFPYVYWSSPSFSGNSRWLFLEDGKNNVIYDLQNGKTFDFNGWVRGYLQNGRYVMMLNKKEELKVFNTETGSFLPIAFPVNHFDVDRPGMILSGPSYQLASGESGIQSSTNYLILQYDNGNERRNFDHIYQFINLNELSSNPLLEELDKRWGEGAPIGLELLSLLLKWGVIKNENEFKQYVEVIDPLVQRFSAATASLDGMRIIKVFRRTRIFETVHDQGGDVIQHFKFYVELIEQKRPLHAQIINRVFDAVKKGLVSAELPEEEQTRIKHFIDRTGGFNLVFYEYFKSKGTMEGFSLKRLMENPDDFSLEIRQAVIDVLHKFDQTVDSKNLDRLKTLSQAEKNLLKTFFAYLAVDLKGLNLGNQQVVRMYLYDMFRKDSSLEEKVAVRRVNADIVPGLRVLETLGLPPNMGAELAEESGTGPEMERSAALSNFFMQTMTDHQVRPSDITEQRGAGAERDSRNIKHLELRLLPGTYPIIYLNLLMHLRLGLLGTKSDISTTIQGELDQEAFLILCLGLFHFGPLVPLSPQRLEDTINFGNAYQSYIGQTVDTGTGEILNQETQTYFADKTFGWIGRLLVKLATEGKVVVDHDNGTPINEDRVITEILQQDLEMKSILSSFAFAFLHNKDSKEAQEYLDFKNKIAGFLFELRNEQKGPLFNAKEIAIILGKQSKGFYFKAVGINATPLKLDEQNVRSLLFRLRDHFEVHREDLSRFREVTREGVEELKGFLYQGNPLTRRVLDAVKSGPEGLKPIIPTEDELIAGLYGRDGIGSQEAAEVLGVVGTEKGRTALLILRKHNNDPELQDAINRALKMLAERFGDAAMNTSSASLETKKFSILTSNGTNKILQKGGIDLNPAQMSMQVNKDGQDFKFDFNGTEIDAAQVTGASFTIRTMTPVTNLPLILGLNQEPSNNSKQEMSVSA